MQFDRTADVKFTSYESFYNVEILLSRRIDLQFLLGKEAIENKQLHESLFIEILCNPTFPSKLRYNSKKMALQITIDYVARVYRLNGEQQQCLETVKSYVHQKKQSKKETELEKRNKRKAEDSFIDSSNMLVEVPLVNFDLLENRRTRRCSERVVNYAIMDEEGLDREYKVREILDMRPLGTSHEYLALWSDGTRTWEPRENFIVADDDEVVKCDALVQWEKKLAYQS